MTGSSAADFFEDAGPDFDPKRAPAAPAPDEVDELDVPFEEWDEARIKEFLVMQGQTAHWMFRVGEIDTETWLHTERDLDAIAPPLTRILNRYDATRAAAAAGDEILLAAAVSRYGMSNWAKRRRMLATLAAQEPAPITGVPAPQDSGPEADEEWARIHEMPPAITPKGGRR